MKMWSVVAVTLIALSFPWSVTSVEVKIENLPRLPGATSLMGYPPYSLTVTTGDATSSCRREAVTGRHAEYVS